MIWYYAHQLGHTVNATEAPPVGEGGQAGGLLLLYVGRAIALIPLLRWLGDWINGR
jgi:hypothetical protein